MQIQTETITTSIPEQLVQAGNRMANNSVDFTAAKDDGGGSGENQHSKMCKTPVRSPLPEYKNSVFLQARYRSCHPTSSVKSL